MHKVKSAKYLKNYELEILFENWKSKCFNMESYINKGLSFIPLKEKNIFQMFKVKGDTIVWITWADMSPDFLYEKWYSK